MKYIIMFLQWLPIFLALITSVRAALDAQGPGGTYIKPEERPSINQALWAAYDKKFKPKGGV